MTAGVVVFVGLLLALSVDPVAGSALAIVAILAALAAWGSLRTGKSTVESVSELQALIGTGTAVLVEVYSDT